ncbi:chromosomal replication initiator protein DnaA [Candidatus Microgenomates bacterium]|nr:chromosomal replication initiator protein DnaA [Candidatus Microgenomates bacterium]
MTDQTFWKKVLAELQLEVSSAVFSTLFKHTRLSDISGGVVTIACMTAVIAQLIETRYYALIKTVLDKHTGQNVSVIFTVDASLKKTNGQKSLADAGPLFQIADNISSFAKRHGLFPDYTFEKFAVSTTNQLAFAAASHVAKNPGNSYNPLFIYGGVGVGKTHLMQAAANKIMETRGSARLVLCAGEEFTNEIIEAIRTKSTPSFRHKFRKAELLCIDDVQFIAGKDAVQEEFFHTFNAVLKAGGQIVLTSDKPPAEILKLEARLKSRLEGGLLVDIAPPDFELRTAIFLIKAKDRGIDFPLPLAKLIAASIDDTRGLEGMLTRILSELAMKNSQLSEELIVRLLGKRYHGQNKEANSSLSKPPAKDAFMEAVCSYFGVKSTQVKGKKRDQSIVLPRQILMYLLRIELGTSLTEVGDLIGGRDHTTVMHAVGKISSLVPADEKLRGDILGIKKLIYG